MEAVTPLAVDEAHAITFAEDQPEYTPLPALSYPDGRILIEWTFTDEERVRIARGENLLHWVWKHPQSPLQPIKLEVANARH